MASAPTSSRVRFTLLESGRRTSMARRLIVGGSMTAQVSAVFAVAMGYAAMQASRPEIPDLDENPSFLAPFRQSVPRPVQERLSFAAIGGAVAPVVPTTPTTQAPRELVAPVPEVSGGDARPASEEREVVPERAFSDIEVDSAVVRDSTSAGPDYPPEMLAKGIEGSVLATFIVDTTGRPDTTTFLALEATHPAFSAAVRAALPKMKFRPAMMAGQRVRQLVEQRFGFRVVNPVAKPPNAKTPSV